MRSPRLVLILVLALACASCGGQRAGGPGGAAPAPGGPAAGPSQGGKGPPRMVLSRSQQEVFEKLRRYMEQDEIDEGIAFFEAQAKSHPRMPLLAVLQATLLEARGDTKRAKEVARRALDLSGGRNPLAHQVLGSVALREGDPKEALREYELALKLAPAGSGLPATMHAEMAYVKLWTEGTAAARVELEKGVRLDQANPRVVLMQCILEWIDGRRDQAATAAVTLMEHHPDQLAPVFAAATTLMEAGKIEEAGRILDRAQAGFPGVARIRLLKAELLALGNRPGELAPQAALGQITSGPLPGALGLWQKLYPGGASTR